MNPIKVDLKELANKHIEHIDCSEIKNYESLNKYLMILHNTGVSFGTIIVSSGMAKKLMEKFPFSDLVIDSDSNGEFTIQGLKHKYKLEE